MEPCYPTRFGLRNLLAKLPVSMLSKNGLMKDKHAKTIVKFVAIIVDKTLLKQSNLSSDESFDTNM